jgi:hypothetical protein
VPVKAGDDPGGGFCFIAVIRLEARRDRMPAEQRGHRHARATRCAPRESREAFSSSPLLDKERSVPYEIDLDGRHLVFSPSFKEGYFVDAFNTDPSYGAATHVKVEWPIGACRYYFRRF